MRKLNAKWLRIARICGIVIILFAVTSFTALLEFEVGIHFGSYRFVALANATLQGGRNENRLTTGTTEMPRGFYARQAWNRDWATSWRPFHGRGSAGGAPYHMLVIPLWPLMPLGAAIAAYAHGVLVGMRRARTSECQSCGYDLRKTPIVDGKRKCPECGLAAAIKPADGTPAPPDAA